MGSAEPGAELWEEHIGANSQQQRLLLDKAIAASIKKKKKIKVGEMCQCVRLLGKWFKDVCVWYSNTALSLSTHGSRKLGQCARLINCLSTRSAIVFFFLLLVVLLVYVMFYSDRSLSILACQDKTSKFLWCRIERFYFWKTHWFWLY